MGSRIKLRYTRAMINAIHSGELANAETVSTPIFELKVHGIASMRLSVIMQRPPLVAQHVVPKSPGPGHLLSLRTFAEDNMTPVLH